MKTKKQTFVVLLASGIVALLACGAAFVGGGGSSSGGGISSDQASVIASNAAKSLMVWTNSNGTISNTVAGSNFLFRSSTSNQANFTIETTVLGATPTNPLVKVSNAGTNVFQLGPRGDIALGADSDISVSTTYSLYSMRNQDRGDQLNNFWFLGVSSQTNGDRQYQMTHEVYNDVDFPYGLIDMRGSSTNHTTPILQLISGELTSELWINDGHRTVVDIWPSSGAGSTAHTFNTSRNHTSGKILTFQNLDVEVLGVDFTGKISGGSLDVGTNVSAFNFVTTNLLSGQTYTNFAQRGHVLATVVLTNILASDFSAMALIVDDDANGTWDRTNGPVSLQGVIALAGQQQLRGLLQPGARFAFTNQSAGTSPSATIRSGSCEWSRW